MEKENNSVILIVQQHLKKELLVLWGLIGCL